MADTRECQGRGTIDNGSSRSRAGRKWVRPGRFWHRPYQIPNGLFHLRSALLCLHWPEFPLSLPESLGMVHPP